MNYMDLQEGDVVEMKHIQMQYPSLAKVRISPLCDRIFYVTECRPEDYEFLLGMGMMFFHREVTWEKVDQDGQTE